MINFHKELPRMGSKINKKYQVYNTNGKKFVDFTVPILVGNCESSQCEENVCEKPNPVSDARS